MRAVLLLFFTVCLALPNVVFARDPGKIAETVSPDGKYTLSAIMQTETTLLIEFKNKSGKTAGKIVVSDFDGNDRHSNITALWRADATAVALNIDHGVNITECRVLANERGSWVELSLPKDPLEKIRKAGNTQGGKAVDHVGAQSWLPGQRLAISYSGNNGTDYGLIFHLVRGWKPHLEYLQTMAAKGAPAEARMMNELPCTFRVFAGGTEGSADGSGVTAQFKNPSGLAIDATGNVYVADRTNQTLRRIRPTGETETMAGAAGENGTVDGAGKAARFWYPQGLAIDERGNIYVADTAGKCVRKVTPDGQVSTLASGFKYPTAVAVNHDGDVFVTDSSNHLVQKIARDGKVSVVAGKAGESGAKNGRGEEARFHFPCGIAIGADGALYVVEHYAVRKIDGKGNVTTFAGSLEEEGRNDGTGATARFWGLTAIAADAKGNLYVADHEVKNLRRISRSGVVQTIRTAEHTDLPLQNPMAVAVDGEGRIFVADQNDSTILLVEPIGARETTAK